MEAKIDPELLRQLDQTTASQEPVEVVVRLRSADPGRTVAAPEKTEGMAHQIVDRVKVQLGRPFARMNIFRNLGSFVIAADPSFVRELIGQPEVAAAMANRQPGEALIPPVHSRPVELDEIGKEKARGPQGPSSRKAKRAR